MNVPPDQILNAIAELVKRNAVPVAVIAGIHHALIGVRSTMSVGRA